MEVLEEEELASLAAHQAHYQEVSKHAVALYGAK